MLQKKLLDAPILYLSSYILKNKNDYYNLLQKTRITAKYEPWILYILDGIIETAKNALHRSKAIKDLLDLTAREVKLKCPKIYSKDLLELIFENPYSKIDFLVKKLDINRKTASKYLKELEREKFLLQMKAGKEVLYINTKLMKILEN